MIGTVQTPQAIRTAFRQPDHGLQVLMIGLGPEILAIETSIVREIIDPVPMTPVPGARDFLPALINVRGNVIPLADLALRLDMKKEFVSTDTRIVVIDIDIDGEPVTAGIIADKVYEVTEVAMTGAIATPKIGAQWNPDFVRFMVKWNGEFVIVPDLELLLK